MIFLGIFNKLFVVRTFIPYHILFCRYLLKKGADKSILTEDGERPLDLVDPTDFTMVRVMLKQSGKANIDSDSDKDSD